MRNDDTIFLLGSSGELEPIRYRPYASETVLQELIADHPDLLAGDQIDPDDPPRWLVVREAGIPDADGASARWSADHLLLDQNGVPTFVEVKRSTDTRIRREVIGQMLDYAANATVYWPADRIRSIAADQCGGVDELDRKIHELAGSDEGDIDRVEAYWRVVEENLRRGPLRLLFVADEIPRELRRVIEFLNEHMPRVEVLGVEVRQYEKGSLRALVPRLIGQTEQARTGKSTAPSSRKTTEAEFFGQCPTWSHDAFATAFREARARGFEVSWATKGFSIRVPAVDRQPIPLFYGYPAGALGHATPSVEVYLKYADDLMDTSELRSKLLQQGFHQGGQFTLRLMLTEDVVDHLVRALPDIWAAYESMKEAAIAEADEIAQT